MQNSEREGLRILFDKKYILALSRHISLHKFYESLTLSKMQVELKFCVFSILISRIEDLSKRTKMFWISNIYSDKFG